MGRFPRYLIVAACLLFGESALASISQFVTGTTAASFNDGASNVSFFGSAAAAWNALMSDSGTGFSGCSGSYSQGASTHVSGGHYTSYALSGSFTCPGAGRSYGASGTLLVCDTGYTLNATDSTCIIIPSNCAQSSDQSFKTSLPMSGQPSASICYNGCNYKITSPGSLLTSAPTWIGLGINLDPTTNTTRTYTGRYTALKTTCTSNTSGYSGTADGQALSGNHSLIVDPTNKSGSFDGDNFTMKPVASGSCVTSPKGNVFCVSNNSVGTGDAFNNIPPTPPAPNTGVAGSPATPTAVASQAESDGSTTSTSIYTSSQAAGSTVSAPPGAVTNSTGTGAPGTVQGGTSAGSSSPAPGDPSKPAVIDCETSHTCTDASGATGSDAPTDVKDFAQSTADFYASLSASPIGSSMSSVGAGFPSGGTVPSSSFDAFGRTYTLTPPQAVIDAITPVVMWIMRAVWSWIALRRFMEA